MHVHVRYIADQDGTLIKTGFGLVSKGYFVTGTDTGVGKSLISTALIRAFATSGLRAVGMKPVAAGAQRVDGVWLNDDVEALIQASNIMAPREWVNPYCFAAPVAPHIAAQDEKISIKNNHLQFCLKSLSGLADMVVVEGAGGFLVPISEQQTLGDTASGFQLPVILVVGMRLGCLNHALLTAEAIRARGLELAGWVANHIEAEMPRAVENVQTLRQMLASPMLASVPWMEMPDANIVAASFRDFARSK